MDKPKILFIVTLPPPVHGAAMMGQYIRQSKLINSSFHCDFINLQTSKKLTETGRGFFSKFWTILALYEKVFLTLIQTKHDLCYISITANGAGFYKDFGIVVLLKLFRKKIIYHFQNKGVSKSNGWLNTILYRFTFRNTRSILLSPFLYPDIEKYVDKENVFYCPNAGADIAKRYTIDLLKQKSNTKSPCKLVFLSNMIEQKGVLILLEACSILKKNNVIFECHFVGGWADITENDFKQKVSDLNLKSVVFSHGPKYNQEKLEFLETSDIFVFPTFYHYEAFPLVALEAMQHGLPIISTPEGGIREIIIDGETGFLVPQQNAKELATKIKVLIDSPGLRKKMGIAARNRFEQEFTLEKFENRMANILTKVTHSYCAKTIKKP